MQLETKFDIGQKVYVVGQPDGGCQCTDCGEEHAHGAWNILGAHDPATGHLEPLTIQAIFVVPSEEPEDPYGVTILYGMKETPGDCFEESQCQASIQVAMEVVQAMNEQTALSQ